MLFNALRSLRFSLSLTSLVIKQTKAASYSLLPLFVLFPGRLGHTQAKMQNKQRKYYAFSFRFSYAICANASMEQAGPGRTGLGPAHNKRISAFG